MTRSLGPLAVVVGILAGCAPTLAGFLKSPDGAVVTGAEARVNIVSLANAEADATTLTVEVDGDGAFSTSEKLPPGSYLVEALVPGYALTSQTVSIGETDHVELVLAPVGVAKANTTRARAELDAARGAGGAMLTPPSL